MAVIEFLVPESKDNIDVKTFLRKACGVSSRQLIQLKRANNGITCNGKHIRVVDVLKSGDKLALSFPQDESEIIPVKGKLNIVYEDEHFIVINKPSNMPVHPTHDHITDTLANFVTYYYEQNNINCKFRAINRLDKDTTGLVLVAKNRYSSNLPKQHIYKTYYAVCEGSIECRGVIDVPIHIKAGHTIQREAGAHGLNAVTHYEPIMRKNNHTLAKIYLETGRTHQIRVHMSYISHPLAGDDMYGGSLKLITRQALHCGKMRFFHPVTGELINLSAPIPEDMQSIIEYEI